MLIISTTGLQALRLSGSQALRLSGSQALRLSGSQALRLSGSQALIILFLLLQLLYVKYKILINLYIFNYANLNYKRTW
jgi:hypothetical protein